MLNRDYIENRLKDVDPQLCVAFTARCSLRVLPLLVANKNKEPFWFWDKANCSNYILIILTAQQMGINFSAFGRKNYTSETSVKAKVEATKGTATIISASAVDSIAYATNAYGAYFISDSSSISYAAAAAASFAAVCFVDPFNNNIETEILMDLDKISNASLSNSRNSR